MLSIPARAARHLPGLRRLPIAKLLVVGELLLLARDHVTSLDPAERRRFIQLMRAGRGRRRNLSAQEQDELAALIQKANPRLFVGMVADRFSPVPLPGRVVRGK